MKSPKRLGYLLFTFMAAAGCSEAPSSSGTLRARFSLAGRSATATRVRIQGRHATSRIVEVAIENGAIQARLPARNIEYVVSLLDNNNTVLGPIRWPSGRGSRVNYFRASRNLSGKRDAVDEDLNIDLGDVADDATSADEFGCSSNPLAQLDSDGDNQSDLDDADDDNDGTDDDHDDTPFGEE